MDPFIRKVIIWRFRECLSELFFIANVLPLLRAQVAKTVRTAQLDLKFVFLCFFRLNDLSSCLCMPCFTVDSSVISLHVLSLA